jgi:hypothetical protein
MRCFLSILGIWFCWVAFAVSADLPFPVGEELRYSVSWNFIPVAWSRSVVERDTVDGREVIALRIETKTYAFFNSFFKVDDFHESLIDPETFLPIRYTKNLKEGNYRAHEVTTFDFENLTAHFVSKTNDEEKEYAIEPDTRDIVSFMYFMRSREIEPESQSCYRVMADEKLYDLMVNARGLDEIDLDHYPGKIPSLEMVPEAKFDGLFVSEGKATLWVSRDVRRLMTFAKLKVPFGRVRVKLEEVSGPGDDFWITEKENRDDENE